LSATLSRKKAIEIPHIYIYKDPGKDRDRGKRLRLPSCLLIETDSTGDLAQPAVPCSSQFRYRLATIPPELQDESDSNLETASELSPVQMPFRNF
jgi:hypothetical protein